VVTIPATINGLNVIAIGRAGLLGLDYASVFQGGYVTSVIIPPGVIIIGANAFNGCTALTNITVPDTVVFFDEYAFGECTNLGSLVIPESVTSIGGLAFYNCGGLTNIIIPESVESIGVYAFYGCGGLTNASIADGLVSMDYGAFYGCTNLTSVMIPSSVTSIAGAFAGCLRLTNIIADPSNTFFTTVNGILFDKSLTTLVEYPGGLSGDYMIPENVTNIAGDAFEDCSLLTGVTIPKGVISIGSYAFSACGVTNIYFLGNAPAVDSSVFSYDVATVYDLPGTTGWPTFTKDTGITLTQWNPVIETRQTNLGVGTNAFGFTISWASNLTFVVQACTNLAMPVWTPLKTNIVTGPSLNFTDPQWTNFPARFYRIVAP
jgi:hypothetical protein